MMLLRKLSLAAFFLLAGACMAHELEENRATLVLRDKTHVSVTLYVALADALRLALAPQKPLPEFLAVYSAMRPEDLQEQLVRAQSRFQSRVRLFLPAGGEVPLTNWVWPDARKVQALFQQRIMQAVVDPAGHSHEDPLEIHAEVVTPVEITSVRVQFPEEFGKVLVVGYRPTQIWVEPKTVSPAIRF